MVRIRFVIGDLLVRFGAIIAPLGLKARSVCSVGQDSYDFLCYNDEANSFMAASAPLQ